MNILKNINKGKNMKKQQGFSLLSMIFFIMCVAVLGIFGFQIGMGYLDQQTIRGAVKATLLEAKSNNLSSKDIKAMITKRLYINTIDINKEEISVTKNETEYEVEIEYEKIITVSKDISIVMNLTIDEVGPR